LAEAVPHKNFEGVFWIENYERKLATVNLIPGFKSCNENLIKIGDFEYREWSPYRSKAAAAIWKNVRSFFIRKGSKILYLGIASGTTASYFSDIIGRSGVIYGVEFSPRVMRELIPVAERRGNIIPVLADARFPERYRSIVESVDAIYCDIAQPEQAKVLADNADMYLKPNGGIMLAVKARSVDVAMKPSNVFKREVEVLRGRNFDIHEVVRLEPYERDHAMVIGTYKGRG
jgi:fibrillarin-like pre-rRNA processing protein